MSSAKKTMIILGGVTFIALIGIGAVFMIFTKLATVEFVPGNEIYLRDVYVVIDQTLSMGQGERMEAREMLKTEILKGVGPGDRVSCYRIASNFKESNDRVFASTRYLPKVFENVTTVGSSELPAGVKADLVNRWRNYDREKDDWVEQLDNLNQPHGNYSDYLGVLAEVGRRINNSADPNLAGEKWLVMIGDLKHEPVSSDPPAPKGNEKRQYSGVHINLVYPGGLHPRAEQDRIERFWKKYFTARGGKAINFISYDGFTGRFPDTTIPRPMSLN